MLGATKQAMSVVKTRRLPLAVWWLSHGLIYLETSAVEDPSSCEFSFDDPMGQERSLTRAFFGNKELQGFLYCRAAIARSLYVAKKSADRRCTVLPPSRGAGRDGMR